MGTTTRARACGKKRRFPSRDAATHEAERLEREAGGIRLVAYRCRYCDRWHVGHEHPGRW